MSDKHHHCRARFPLALRAIHWITAILVITTLALASNLFFRGINHDTMKFIGYHEQFGVLILLLTLIRLPIRATARMCGLTGNLKYIAYVVEVLLYVCLFGMPIFGALMSSFAGYPITFFGTSIPTFTPKIPHMHDVFMVCHNYLAGLFVALISLHIAAAIYHAVFLKDKVMSRMGFTDLVRK